MITFKLSGHNDHHNREFNLQMTHNLSVNKPGDPSNTKKKLNLGNMKFYECPLNVNWHTRDNLGKYIN
uniref:Uncharacterized protein n=1 Tax=Anguilla anguilla TaxID=7936 RepID=A0A0E9WNI7_ANGAN